LLAVPLLAMSMAVAANPHHGMMAGHGSALTAGPVLGVGVSDLSPDTLSARGLEHGVRVETVAADSPAAAAGLQAGDVLVEMGGKAVYSGERLKWLVGQAPAGEPIAVKFLRGDSTQTASVTFASGATDRAQGGAEARSSGWPVLGLRFQPMTPDLRAASGAPDGLGVVVTQVMDQGPAARAGLAVGDVIVRIDRRAIHGAQDVQRALGFFNPGDTVEIEVIRAQQRETVTATLGDAGGRMLGHGLPMWGHGMPPMGMAPGCHHPGHGHP
jgi:serine protease Do